MAGQLMTLSVCTVLLMFVMATEGLKCWRCGPWGDRDMPQPEGDQHNVPDKCSDAEHGYKDPGTIENLKFDEAKAVEGTECAACLKIRARWDKDDKQKQEVVRQCITQEDLDTRGGSCSDVEKYYKQTAEDAINDSELTDVTASCCTGDACNTGSHVTTASLLLAGMASVIALLI